MQILFEDNHLLCINKPAGLLSQGDSSGDQNVVDLLKDYRKQHEAKPGEAFIGLVHRLDRPVSGVMVLAKTSKAARRLAESWHSSSVLKIYTAVIPSNLCTIGPGWETFSDKLIKDPATNTVRVVDENSSLPGTQLATLKARRINAQAALAEIEIQLGTGRGHQIRVQLAYRGMPILGDRKYGSTHDYRDETGHPRLALHARQLCIMHPTLKKTLCLFAPWPSNWPIRQSSNKNDQPSFQWKE